MTIDPKAYVTEWSHSQQQFHIQTIAEMIKANLGQYWQNRGPDYIPLAFFDTAKEAHAFAHEIESQRAKKANQ